MFSLDCLNKVCICMMYDVSRVKQSGRWCVCVCVSMYVDNNFRTKWPLT